MNRPYRTAVPTNFLVFPGDKECHAKVSDGSKQVECGAIGDWNLAENARPCPELPLCRRCYEIRASRPLAPQPEASEAQDCNEGQDPCPRCGQVCCLDSIVCPGCGMSRPHAIT